MDAAKVRARFTAAIAGGYGADWFDPARHDAEQVGRRMLAGPPRMVGAFSDERVTAEGERVFRAAMDDIRGEARRRGVPGY